MLAPSLFLGIGVLLDLSLADQTGSDKGDFSLSKAALFVRVSPRRVAQAKIDNIVQSTQGSVWLATPYELYADHSHTS